VYRITLAVFLQNQHARTFVIIGIIFNNGGLVDRCKDIPDGNAILGQLIIAMV